MPIQVTFKKLAESKGFRVKETSRMLTLDDNVNVYKLNKHKIHLIDNMIIVNRNDFLQILKDSKTLAENSE